MGCHCNAYVPIPKFLEWIGIIISSASFIPLVVAIATQHWLTYRDNSKNITIEYGLWEYCLYKNCAHVNCGAVVDTPQGNDGNTINYTGGILTLLGCLANLAVFILECGFLSNIDAFVLNFFSILTTAVALIFTTLGLTMYVNQAEKMITVDSFQFGFGLACFAMVLHLLLLLIGIARSQGKKPIDPSDASERKKQVYWKDILLYLMLLVSLLTLTLAIISLATNSWLIYKTERNKCEQYHYGLWRFCFYDNTEQIKCDNLQNIPRKFKITKNKNPRIPILLAAILHLIILPIFYFLFKNKYIGTLSLSFAMLSMTSFVLSVTGISVLTANWNDSELSFMWDYSYVFCWIATFGYFLHAVLCIAFYFAPKKPTEIRKATLSVSSRRNTNGNSHHLPNLAEPEFTIPTYIIDPYDITDSPNMVHKREVAERTKEKTEQENEGQTTDSNEGEELSDYILEIVKEIEDTASDNCKRSNTY